MSAVPLFGVRAIMTPPSTQKTPQKSIYSWELRRSGAARPKPLPRLTKSGRSRISRGQLSADGSALAEGAAQLRGRKRLRFGRTGIPGRDLNFNRQICPGQRRTAREADLSTQQTGAQAPSRLPRPSRHHRRQEGSGRTPCPRPQAPERLILNYPRRFSPEIRSWSG